MNHLDELFTAIAAKHLFITTLETRKSDRLDFHEVSVWGIKDALLEAYQAGVGAELLTALRETTWLLDACARNAGRLGQRKFAAKLRTVMTANRAAIAKAEGDAQ
jgi:hypothetical protein